MLRYPMLTEGPSSIEGLREGKLVKLLSKN